MKYKSRIFRKLIENIYKIWFKIKTRIQKLS